jgi:hypothetical protein
MRAFRAMVLALCTMSFPMQAHALGIKFCNDIEDDRSRMACLQEHISQMEETIVALGGQVAALEHELGEKLGVGVTYKLRSVAQGQCLGLTGDKQPALVACDNPDSWILLAGPQIKKPEKPAAPAANPTPAPSAASSQTPPAAAPTSAAQPNAANPCKGLDQLGCTAKSADCAWKPDKNKCGRKNSQ